LYLGFKRFGLGDLTGIPLPVESGGQLRRWESWDDWDLTRIPFGYSLLATPLQMTMAMAAIANEGRLMRPLLVKRIEDDEGQAWLDFMPEVRGQAISPEAARELVHGLQGVVEERGTGSRAALPHHAVAGKTGTAFKYVRGRYSDTLLLSSFVGFFPAGDPALCIGVFVDEPGGTFRSGGAVAGPVFREIAARAAEYMGIPPSAVVPGRNLVHERVLGPLTTRLER
jgi:cell division protein FtsI (penicillin-binding protein 3)